MPQRRRDISYNISSLAENFYSNQVSSRTSFSSTLKALELPVLNSELSRTSGNAVCMPHAKLITESIAMRTLLLSHLLHKGTDDPSSEHSKPSPSEQLEYQESTTQPLGLDLLRNQPRLSRSDLNAVSPGLRKMTIHTISFSILTDVQPRCDLFHYFLYLTNSHPLQNTPSNTSYLKKIISAHAR